MFLIKIPKNEAKSNFTKVRKHADKEGKPDKERFFKILTPRIL